MEWISLIAVKGPADHPQLQGCLGAYVTVVVVADTHRECMSRIWEEVQAIDLVVNEVEWCEPLAEHLAKYDVDDYLAKQVEATKADGQTRFGVFHAWESEE